MWHKLLGDVMSKKNHESCQVHGAPNPEFKLIGNDITVKFTALKDAKTSKSQNDTLDEALNEALNDDLREKITLIITKHPKINY